MDLHLTAAQPTLEEKAAVDAAVVEPPERDQLLPVLHAIQASRGWISPGALNYASLRLGLPPAETHGVASFYGMFSMTPRARVVAHVCEDIACLTRGAGKLCEEMEARLGPAGSGADAAWLRSPCLGLCERAPAALVTAAGKTPRERVIAPGAPETIEAAIRLAVDGNLSESPDFLDTRLSVPQAGAGQLRLMRRVGVTNPMSLADYRRLGGYEALARAFELGPQGVVREVIESRLLGRGGAAFPAGKKWEALLAPRMPGRPRYIVCNADESEPGTFKDRVLMEGDPFAILEGMTIGALATGARRGYIYVRGEYPLAARRVAGAIASARDAGLLGENILGRGLCFDIELRRGAGAYICGEETALFNSIEGYRGEPRNKPPYPTECGLFRQPTAVNNVETLMNIPEIIRIGAAAYARIGTEKSTGYKLYCVCGHVSSPGVYETPFGPTLRELIAMAGGVSGSGRLQAVLLGGAAGAFVTPAELDTPLTFEGTRAIGATLGSGVVMLFDDTVDLKRILLRIAAFFREETCGQCVPCRIGAVRQEETLHRLVHGHPHGPASAELATLREMGQAMRDASICGLGQTASSALESALNRWSLFHE
ncbi:MAG TPA: NAD(P)H-dependent oxidoreductase subunit E [Bryobacteraceae bacterium]|jgi:NADH-quinone oxidoreductase subunit F|nr:NAD(P)H-dependent oxidoreductase subunit E [Bryobacteraceae bacterium]